MKKRYLILVMFFVSLSGFAQVTDVLSPRDLRRVAKYQTNIDKGEVYIRESDGYLAKIKSLSSSGRRFEKDSAKLTHKFQRARLLAFTYLDDGYGDLYKVYSKAVKRQNLITGNSQVADLMAAGKVGHKNGRKFFKKVPDEMDKAKAVKLLDLGVEKESAAVDRLKDAVNVLNGGAVHSEPMMAMTVPIIQPVTLAVDSLLGKQKAALLTEVAIPVARIDSSSLVSTAVKSMDNAVSFITIQFSASKTRLSQQEVSFYYRGSYLVVMMEGDGYYRYSVGKFASAQDAQSVIEKENIKGYIVGYLNNKRAGVAEVTRALTLNN